MGGITTKNVKSAHSLPSNVVAYGVVEICATEAAELDVEHCSCLLLCPQSADPV